jgi:hypothetical protein
MRIRLESRIMEAPAASVCRGFLRPVERDNDRAQNLSSEQRVDLDENAEIGERPIRAQGDEEA